MSDEGLIYALRWFAEKKCLLVSLLWKNAGDIKDASQEVEDNEA